MESFLNSILEELKNKLSDVIFEKSTQEVNESYFDGMAYAYGNAIEIVEESLNSEVKNV